MDRVVVWPQPRKSTISLFKCKTCNIRFCGSTLYIHNDSSVTRWQWYVQEEERSNYLKNYFELGHRISGSILTREALAMIIFESFVSFSSAAESATKLRISADKNFKVHIYIYEREKERENDSSLNAPSSSSSNFFLSSLTTYFVTHGDCGAPTFISSRSLEAVESVARSSVQFAANDVETSRAFSVRRNLELRHRERRRMHEISDSWTVVIRSLEYSNVWTKFER